MPSHLAPLAIIWGSVALLAILTLLAWQQRPKPGAVLFAIAMLCGTWWAAATALGLSATSDATMLFWARVGWAGIAFGPVAWFLFALEFSGRDEYATPWMAALISVLPTTTVFLAMTNSLHGLVYLSTTRASAGPLSVLNVQFGLWFWIHYGFALLLMGSGVGMIVQLAIGNRDRYLDQVLVLLVVVSPPLVGSTAYLFGLEPFQALDPTPFTFLLSGIAGIAALKQYQFLDPLPVSDRLARESLVDDMEQGVVVVDSNDLIVKMNPAARRLFGCGGSAIGDHASDVLPEHEHLAAAQDDERVTITVQQEGHERIFEVQVTELHKTRAGSSGEVLVFHDVTEQRTQLQRLDVLNRVLRHNLRNEMNVVYGYADRIQNQTEVADTPEIAGQIKEKALAMTATGDRAREIDDILQGGNATETTAALSALVGWELERIETEHSDVTVDCEGMDVDSECPVALETILRILVDEILDNNEREEAAMSIDVGVDNGLANIVLTDNGVGIPETERKALESGEETALRHGSGLGLWLATWGVQAIDGSITLTTDKSDGTVVKIVAPCAAAEVGPSGT